MASQVRSISVSETFHKAQALLPDQSQRSKSLEALATMTAFRRGQEVCGQHGNIDYWFRVVSGVVGRCALLADGRRQIVDLLLPGDFFAFSAQPQSGPAIEAIVDGTVVARFPRKRLEILADSNPDVAREIRDMAFQAISRMQDQLLILGRTTALEKVGSFLLSMADRLADSSTADIVLPMSRYDIADYLAVSVETVSRALTDLKHRGVIRFGGIREVTIVDPDALASHPARHEPDNDDWSAFENRIRRASPLASSRSQDSKHQIAF